MRTPSRRHLLVAATALAAFGAGPAAAQAAPGDMTLGNPNAKVKVVEYASLSCSHCAAFNETVFPAFKAKYIDTGRVHYTFREFLTEPANIAAAGYLMARCAGPGKYFTVVDAVFRSQPRWNDAPSVKPIFVDIAKANGLSEAQFEACMGDKAAIAALTERVRKAVDDDKIHATPTFVINGKTVKEGGMTLAELDAAIAAAAK
jgi:protein-disulfide isomerase